MIMSFWFSLGLMLMDYGASFKCNGIGQSLIFERVEPRVMYHSGLLMTIASFLILVVLCAYYLSGEKR
jgi:hypothetical protein